MTSKYIEIEQSMTFSEILIHGLVISSLFLLVAIALYIYWIKTGGE